MSRSRHWLDKLIRGVVSAFTVNMDIIYVRFCNGVHSGLRMAASVIAREYYVMRGLLTLDKVSENHEGEVFNHF